MLTANFIKVLMNRTLFMAMVIHTQAYCTGPSLQEKHNLFDPISPSTHHSTSGSSFAARLPGIQVVLPGNLYFLTSHYLLSTLQYSAHLTKPQNSPWARQDQLPHLQGPGQSENVGPFVQKSICFPQLL